MKRSYHEFCAVDDPYLHRHRLADDEPPAGVDAPLTATPVVWITPPSIDFRRGLRLRGFKRAIRSTGCISGCCVFPPRGRLKAHC
ncbi:hypothetical protein EAO03_00720 [Klebsiella pneumoniae]|nr:hypothetical protein EAO03_00720 [Klebsiella pneumoniae]